MNKLLIIIIPILFLFSCKNTEKNEKDYSVKGYITGYFEGKVVLSKYDEGKLEAIDSVYMTKSGFKFKHVKIKTPELYYLIVDDGKIIIEFFMEQHDIQVNADYNNKGLLEVQGSKSHDEYLSFLQNNVVFENKQSKIYEQKELAMSNNDTSLLVQLSNNYKDVADEQFNFIKQYVLENDSSFVSAFIASRSLANELSLKDLETITANFKDTIKSSIYYKELINIIEIRKRTQVGVQAPDFSLPDTASVNISLSSLQGKYVFLDFSASWHGVSRSRNPELNIIYKKYKNKGFEIYQASLERNMQQWKNIIKADKINWICVSDIKGLESDIIKLYGIKVLPTNFLLDKNGTIIKTNLTPYDLELYLASVL